MKNNCIQTIPTRPEVLAVLRDLGLSAVSLTTPDALSTADKVLTQLGDHIKTLSWFRKRNPMLGASPSEMIRVGRATQLANYINSTLS